MPSNSKPTIFKSSKPLKDEDIVFDPQEDSEVIKDNPKTKKEAKQKDKKAKISTIEDPFAAYLNDARKEA